MTEPNRSSTPHGSRKTGRAWHPHGWRRTSDGGWRSPTSPIDTRRRSAGTSFLLALAVCVAATIGLVRVHARTRILGLGAELTRLTEEHMRLLEQKRRLSAERAYLRHPQQLTDAARDRLGMVSVPSTAVRTIRLEDEVKP